VGGGSEAWLRVETGCRWLETRGWGSKWGLVCRKRVLVGQNAWLGVKTGVGVSKWELVCRKQVLVGFDVWLGVERCWWAKTGCWWSKTGTGGLSNQKTG
jgi:hypothetical protein